RPPTPLAPPAAADATAAPPPPVTAAPPALPASSPPPGPARLTAAPVPQIQEHDFLREDIRCLVWIGVEIGSDDELTILPALAGG
ncbi:MAG: hypothetical protein KY437_07715, partial [Actinobacteria bacterium]|nr:hypothetical protein [Actinomycetota bacterium]